MPKLVPGSRDWGVSRAPVPLEAQGRGTPCLAFSLPSLAAGPLGTFTASAETSRWGVTLTSSMSYPLHLALHGHPRFLWGPPG